MTMTKKEEAYWNTPKDANGNPIKRPQDPNAAITLTEAFTPRDKYGNPLVDETKYANLIARQGMHDQALGRGYLKNGEFGEMFKHAALNSLAQRSGSTYKLDENGQPVLGLDGKPLPDTYNEDSMFDTNPDLAKKLVRGAQFAGDAIGTGINTINTVWSGNTAAHAAGVQAEIQNQRARESMMQQAGEQADYMNMQNSATTANMTDSAIAQANAFETGMQGIDSSGIEGSANMERNLQYGQSREEAQQQLQYDMMNMGAQGMSNSMAKSFSDLSQRKAGAMNDAFAGSVIGRMNEITTNRQIAGEEAMKAAPNFNDVQDVMDNNNPDAVDKLPNPASAEKPAQTPAATPATPVTRGVTPTPQSATSTSGKLTPNNTPGTQPQATEADWKSRTARWNLPPSDPSYSILHDAFMKGPEAFAKAVNDTKSMIQNPIDGERWK